MSEWPNYVLAKHFKLLLVSFICPQEMTFFFADQSRHNLVGKMVSDQKAPKRMCFRNFNGSSNPKNLQDLVIDLPSCHHRAIHPQPTTTPPQVVMKPMTFCTLPIISWTDWLFFLFWAWDLTTILIYCLKGLGLLDPNAKAKKRVFSNKQKTDCPTTT